MLRKRASAVTIKDDQILMVKMLDKKDRSWWCLPGGTIESGETPEQAVLCELGEELNLQIKPRRRLYKVPMPKLISASVLTTTRHRAKIARTRP